MWRRVESLIHTLKEDRRCSLKAGGGGGGGGGGTWCIFLFVGESF